MRCPTPIRGRAASARADLAGSFRAHDPRATAIDFHRRFSPPGIAFFRVFAKNAATCRDAPS
jgi:hypothetical protein